MFDNNEFGNVPCMYGTPETMFHQIPHVEEIINIMTDKNKFDLQKALAGEPIRTKGGRPARIVCSDAKSDVGDRLVVLVLKDDKLGNEDVRLYTKEGLYVSNGYGSTYEENLEMVPKTIKEWFCLYHHYSHIGDEKYKVEHYGPFSTKEEAEAYGIKGIEWVKKAVYPVEYEE